MVRSRPSRAALPDRLDTFYRHQASDYDHFRERLLPGRQALIGGLPLADDSVWIDLGGGTARNLLFAGDRIGRLKRVYVVDLCRPLLDVARVRVRSQGWRNVALVRGDATRPPLPDGCADVVTCSYSLSMMPDWRAVVARAHTLLKPGGVIGVVDFFVSSPDAAPGRAHHGWLTRSFWPWWFRHAHVYLSPDHLPVLTDAFTTVSLRESRSAVPYVPVGRVPYYQFVGRKPSA